MPFSLQGFKLTEKIRKKDKKDKVASDLAESLLSGTQPEANTKSDVISNSAPGSNWNPPVRVIKTDDAVWQLPGLNKAQFYAASEYLRRNVKNSGFTLGPNKTEDPSSGAKGNIASPLEQITLDHIALLFARKKKSRSVPSEHVTATALRKSGERLEIWIAKNDGPISADEELRRNLEAYLNRTGSWAENTDVMKSDMVRFWEERLEHYANSIKKHWKTLSRARITEPTYGRKGSRGTKHESYFEAIAMGDDTRPEGDLPGFSGLSLAHDMLLDVYRSELTYKHIFEKDWNDAKELCTSRPSKKELKYANETFLPKEIERQSYEFDASNHSEDHVRLARAFSKLLKSIRLIGTISKAQEAFAAFRETIQAEVHVSLRYMDPISCLDLLGPYILAISDTLEIWSRSGLDKGFKKEASDTARTIGKQRSYHRHFHCELQILDKFLDDEDTYDYIGCSKLSCFTCWGVLQGTRFRTRESRANYRSACAFPFTLSTEHGSSRCQLLLALKKVQDHMVERVLRRSLGEDFSQSSPSIAETMEEIWRPQMNGTRSARRTLPGGTTVEVVRARAIRISVDGGVWCGLVDFHVDAYKNRHSKDWDGSDIGIQPYVWFSSGLRSIKESAHAHANDAHSREVYSEHRGYTEDRIMICARRPRSQHQSRDQKDPVNKWYADLIWDCHQYKYDLNDQTCPWRGDLYIYRTITEGYLRSSSSRGQNRGHTELASINDYELRDVLRKCRNALTEDWVTSTVPRCTVNDN